MTDNLFRISTFYDVPFLIFNVAYSLENDEYFGIPRLIHVEGKTLEIFQPTVDETPLEILESGYIPFFDGLLFISDLQEAFGDEFGNELEFVLSELRQKL